MLFVAPLEISAFVRFPFTENRDGGGIRSIGILWGIIVRLVTETQARHNLRYCFLSSTLFLVAR
jgi:hypothetical protein